jgi:4-amino-4-deoxy-L-arabinose transferase-like glycosyltransferase
MPDTPSSRPSPHRFTPSRNRSSLIWLLVLTLLLGFAFQGTRAVWSTDEGRYTENALQMIDSGNYLVPAYGIDRPNFTKPPMHYWAIAASVNAFGHNEWAVRAPNALAFVLTALLLCLIGEQLLLKKIWLPGLIYAVTLAPLIATNVVSTDTLLTLFEALAMFGFVSAEMGPGGRARRGPIYLMWLGFGLAFLTKGPPGLLPLLAIVPFIVKRDGWRALGRIFAPGGVAVFIVVGFLWYLIVVLRYPGLLHYFLYFEIYQRILTPTQNRNPQWYGWLVAYGPVFAFATLPWSLAVFRGAVNAFSVARWQKWWREASTSLFLLLWFALPLLVFCFSRSRLPVYTLPLFLPLSLMLALQLQDRIDLTRTRQQILLGVWIVALIALKGMGGYYLHSDSDNRVRVQQLEAVVAGAPYTALTFVDMTSNDVAIEEHTPWGMRLYINKPIFGIAWSKPDSSASICALLREHASILYVVDPKIAADAFRAAVLQCHPQAATSLGSWRQQRLVLVRR